MRPSPTTPSPLDAEQRATLRAQLVEQRNFRVDQLAQLHLPTQDGPLSSAVPEIFDELAAGARAALGDVLAALRRMDRGGYGLCTGCGRAVETARLEIVPQAGLCMTCERRRFVAEPG